MGSCSSFSAGWSSLLVSSLLLLLLLTRSLQYFPALLSSLHTVPERLQGGAEERFQSSCECYPTHHITSTSVSFISPYITLTHLLLALLTPSSLLFSSPPFPPFPPTPLPPITDILAPSSLITTQASPLPLSPAIRRASLCPNFKANSIPVLRSSSR